MAPIIYLCCALTALGCALLLGRGYRRSRVRLLFWGGLCFALLTVGNLILFVDLELVPHVDLAPWRKLCSLAGALVLLYGLIWERK